MQKTRFCLRVDLGSPLGIGTNKSFTLKRAPSRASHTFTAVNVCQHQPNSGTVWGSHLWVFVNCLVVNPTFDSQTKAGPWVEGTQSRIPTWFGSITEVTTCKVMEFDDVERIWSKFVGYRRQWPWSRANLEQLTWFLPHGGETWQLSINNVSSHIMKAGSISIWEFDNEDYVKCLQSLECSTRCSDFQARSTDLANRA